MRIPKLGKSLNKLNKKSGKFLTKALTALGIIKELSEGNKSSGHCCIKADVYFAALLIYQPRRNFL